MSTVIVGFPWGKKIGELAISLFCDLVASYRTSSPPLCLQEKYYPELCAEAVRVTGADRVVIASHVVRNSGPSKSSNSAVRGGAFMVHGVWSQIIGGAFPHAQSRFFV